MCFCKAHRFAHESSLVGGFNHLEKYESQLGRIIPIHFGKIIQMFQTTNQIRIDESLKGTSTDLANITQKLPAAVSTKNSSEKTKTKCLLITPIVSKYIMNYVHIIEYICYIPIFLPLKIHHPILSHPLSIVEARQDIETRLIDGAIGQPARLAFALEGLHTGAVNAPERAGFEDGTAGEEKHRKNHGKTINP